MILFVPLFLYISRNQIQGKDTNMAFLRSTLLAVSFTATFAQAFPTFARTLPNVTPVLAEGGCSVYPGYDTETGIAGPWTVKIDSCFNATTPNEPCSIEEFGSGSVVFRQEGDTGIHQGYVNRPLYLSRFQELRV